MYKEQIKEINVDLQRTKKAIIALGCSFVQGMGAFDDEIYEKYPPKFTKLGEPLNFNSYPKSVKDELCTNYPTIRISNGDNLDFTFMCYKNSFVNVLCKKYFNGDYTPINFGLSGCGNRATIKELYFHPEIKWDLIEEIIIIYAPSGLERFDFINDQWLDHHHWVAMWPNTDDKEEGPRKSLWTGYKSALYSEKFEVLEQIAHVQELLLWCKHKNARLIITPGFDRRYNKKYFTESYKMKIHRNIEGSLIEIKKSIWPFGSNDDIIDLFPWDNMFLPDGHQTFIDLVSSQEKDPKHFWEYLSTGSPEKWITPCAHPSAKGHDLFARKLFEFIRKD
jgi:hypothetical protein